MEDNTGKAIIFVAVLGVMYGLATWMVLANAKPKSRVKKKVKNYRGFTLTPRLCIEHIKQGRYKISILDDKSCILCLRKAEEKDV
jgi:hypothetical protein